MVRVVRDRKQPGVVILKEAGRQKVLKYGPHLVRLTPSKTGVVGFFDRHGAFCDRWRIRQGKLETSRVTLWTGDQEKVRKLVRRWLITEPKGGSFKVYDVENPAAEPRVIKIPEGKTLLPGTGISGHDEVVFGWTNGKYTQVRAVNLTEHTTSKRRKVKPGTVHTWKLSGTVTQLAPGRLYLGYIRRGRAHAVEYHRSMARSTVATSKEPVPEGAKALFWRGESLITRLSPKETHLLLTVDEGRARTE